MIISAKRLIPLLIKLLGIALFIWILAIQDWERVWETIKGVNIIPILIAVLLYSLIIPCKGIRWHRINNGMLLDTKLSSDIILYSSGFFLGFATPGRLGEMVKALYLQKQGKPLGTSIAGTILDRLMDVCFLLIIAFVSFGIYLITLSEDVKIISRWFELLVAIIIIVIIGGIVGWYLRDKIFSLIVNFLIPNKYRYDFMQGWKGFITGFQSTGWKIIIEGIFIWTLLGNSLYIGGTWFICLSIGINIDILYIVVAISLSMLVNILPISIAGVGTRDGVFAIIFLPIGLSLADSETIALLTLAILVVSLFPNWILHNFVPRIISADSKKAE